MIVSAQGRHHARNAKRELVHCVYADYVAHYYRRGESARRLAVLAFPRMLANPSLYATILVRLALSSPRPLFFIWRNILVAKHSIDVGPRCQIGRGLHLPHPFGIVIASGTSIGTDVMLYHHLTLGTRRARPEGGLDVPTIEHNVVVHANSVVAGSVLWGRGQSLAQTRSWTARRN